MRGGSDGHDRTLIVGHQSKAIVAMIAHRSDHDREVIGPRSRGDHGPQSWTTSPLMLIPSFDEDRHVDMHQDVSTCPPLMIFNRVQSWPSDRDQPLRLMHLI